MNKNENDKTLKVSKKKRISNAKSDQKNMKPLYLKLKKDLMREFEININNDPDYSSRTQFLKEKIEEYNQTKSNE